jgi:hypothetical protein
MQYCERIVQLINCNDEQAGKRMFLDMPKKNKTQMLCLATTHWQSGLTNKAIAELINLI